MPGWHTDQEIVFHLSVQSCQGVCGLSTREERYWEGHYAAGGVSGEGSVGAIRQWKWDQIRSIVGDVDDVVDVGCGDLSFWDDRLPPIYTGIDISETIVAKNRERHPEATFIVADAAVPQTVSGRIVLCMDMLFHIMDDGTYRGILTNLGQYSREWVFVYTWHNNPFEDRNSRRYVARKLIRKGRIFSSIKARAGSATDFDYQTYRRFEDYAPLITDQGFSHVETRSEPAIERWGALYVFRRESR